MAKQLIVPVVTPGGLPEGVQLDQIPGSFTQSCQNLVSYISQYANGLLVAGTTGEGHLLSLDQYSAVLHTYSKLSDRPGYAGLLGRDEDLTSQIAIGRDTGYSCFVLALNHTGNIIQRLTTVLEALRPSDKLFLYNMPGGFPPANTWLLDDLFYTHSQIK